MSVTLQAPLMSSDVFPDSDTRCRCRSTRKAPMRKTAVAVLVAVLALAAGACANTASTSEPDTSQTSHSTLSPSSETSRDSTSQQEASQSDQAPTTNDELVTSETPAARDEPTTNSPSDAPEPFTDPAVNGDTAIYRGSAARHGAYHDAAAIAGEIAWRFEAGSPVRSTAAVADGVAYIGSDGGHLFAIDIATGVPNWTFETGGAVSSSPQVADGVVYFTSEDGKVYAVAAEDGALRWELKTAEPQMFRLRDWNYFSPSPLVVDDVVYVGSRGSAAQFYALDALDGSVKWSVETGRKGVRTAPALLDGTLYVATADYKILALDASDGSEKWSQTVFGEIRSTPAVYGGAVIFGSRAAHTHSLAIETGQEIWRLPEGDGSWVEASPAVDRGVVYIGGSDSHNFHALDATTSDVLWTASFDTNIFTSPAVSAITAYVATGDAYQPDTPGKLYALSRDSGVIEWEFEALAFFSSPTLAEDVLIIGNDDGYVYALQ